MEYTSRVPAPPLDGLIDDIYVQSGMPRYTRLNVPPMPSAHLFINLGAPVRVYDADPAVPPMVLADGWFMGVRTRRFVMEFPAPTRLVGVHFKPWGLAPFVGVPAAEVRDRCVPVDGMWGGSADRLRGRLAAAETAGEAMQVMEDELRSRLAAPRRGFDLVARTAGQVEALWGKVSVRTLSEDAGVSGNHLTAQFKVHSGLAPKRLARIYRFARLILSVDARLGVDWSELARTAGYFDQAHLGNEFREFTGLTPTAYLALRRRHPVDEAFPPDHGPMPTE